MYHYLLTRCGSAYSESLCRTKAQAMDEVDWTPLGEEETLHVEQGNFVLSETGYVHSHGRRFTIATLSIEDGEYFLWQKGAKA